MQCPVDYKRKLFNTRRMLRYFLLANAPLYIVHEKGESIHADLNDETEVKLCK